MTTIYLSGPINEGDNPYEWHDSIRKEWPDIDWINPFELYDIPDEQLSSRVKEIIEGNMRAIRDADVILLRRIESYNLCGASMEAREAYTANVPVIVWNAGKSEVPLFLEGHATEVHNSMEEAVETAIQVAVGED